MGPIEAAMAALVADWGRWAGERTPLLSGVLLQAARTADEASTAADLSPYTRMRIITALVDLVDRCAPPGVESDALDEALERVAGVAG